MASEVTAFRVPCDVVTGTGSDGCISAHNIVDCNDITTKYAVSHDVWDRCGHGVCSALPTTAYVSLATWSLSQSGSLRRAFIILAARLVLHGHSCDSRSF